jgi:chemotaxis protein CheD
VSPNEIFVGMGDVAVTADSNHVLTTIGLGSCVGVALLDPQRHTIGLAHVIFPKAPKPDVDEPGRYADTAVATLLAALARLGSANANLAAVLVGGARMFSFGRSVEPDVGATNLAAIEQALDAARVPIRARATGGAIGRSLRVHAGEAVVSLREGREDCELYRASAANEYRGAA